MTDVDIPEVVAELTAAFESYERALTANDIEAVNLLFHDSPLTLRYGTRDNERHYSHAEIAAFRRQRGPVNQNSRLQNTRITTFGRDFGVANTEYRTVGSDKIGRQSQTWLRTEHGWKIVAAHVSFGI
jgi:hypothetical protein